MTHATVGAVGVPLDVLLARDRGRGRVRVVDRQHVRPGRPHRPVRRKSSWLGQELRRAGQLVHQRQALRHRADAVGDRPGQEPDALVGQLGPGVGEHRIDDGRRDHEAERVHTNEGMLHVALWEPEIPPNTGNVARLCAATGTRLHLIGRLGFRLDDRSLKRAGLDYWPAVDLVRHVTFAEFEASRRDAGARIWCVDNPADRPYTRADFRDGDCLLFGSESKGLAARGAGPARRPITRHPHADRQGPQPQPGHRRRHRAVRGAASGAWLVEPARLTGESGAATRRGLGGAGGGGRSVMGTDAHTRRPHGRSRRRPADT